MDAATIKIVQKAYDEIQSAEQKIKACGNVLRTVLESGNHPTPKRKTYKEQFKLNGKIKKV